VQQYSPGRKPWDRIGHIASPARAAQRLCRSVGAYPSPIMKPRALLRRACGAVTIKRNSLIGKSGRRRGVLDKGGNPVPQIQQAGKLMSAGLSLQRAICDPNKYHKYEEREEKIRLESSIRALCIACSRSVRSRNGTAWSDSSSCPVQGNLPGNRSFYRTDSSRLFEG
jgi:hypothetical protein